MSGAQGKAADICDAISVIAEIDETALKKRLDQGWISQVANSTQECIDLIVKFRTLESYDGSRKSIGFLGNVVDLWEALAENTERTGELIVDLGSDQTSLHNPYNGGYYPAGISLQESQELMISDPSHFKDLVCASLVRHVAAINRMTNFGMRFWDYGNSFLFQASVAGADILMDNDNSKSQKFRYPSYFEDVMGDIFSLGFGPFRWVCSSLKESDLQKTDELAAEVIEELIDELKDIEKSAENSDIKFVGKVKEQLLDNLKWINHAGENRLVVGSQARILYSDSKGRQRIAKAFNDAVKSGYLSSPIVLSRDHHDVSGTDAPFRETANIDDGSMFTADMSMQNAIGLAFRGATYLALHNGGGTGWGNANNGGFGLVLDGSDDAERRSRDMLFWDVNNGVTRRSWAQNSYAKFAIKRAMNEESRLKVVLPNEVKESILEEVTK